MMAAAENLTNESNVLTTLAALLEGDRALNLEASALLLGIAPGTFRQLAAKPGFPKPARMGKRLTWRRRELMQWWEDERARQNRAA
jgi:predicted DNA-binding transcriptional regulator AlpA